MHVVIFEGSSWPSFAPVALNRPVFMLGSGADILLGKQLRHLAPSRLTLWVRPEMVEHCQVRVVPHTGVPTTINEPLGDEPALLINGRTLHFGKFRVPDEESVVFDDEKWVHSAHVKRPGLGPQDVMQRSERWLELLELPHATPQSRLADSLWDLISWNEESIIADSVRLQECSKPTIDGAVHVVNPENICLQDDSIKLEPGCVLDASRGPVIIADHARIGANSVVLGPCYIGAYTNLRPLTVIRPGTTIGMFCNIGGEVSNSIILAYTNKSHDGYLGDSYVGKWVNLGAGTCTSNLKNTYGEISIRLGSREIPTGRRKLGSIIGDHTKTAILTRLMSGTYLGYCCMLAASSLPPRFMPSFTYCTDEGAQPYRMDKAIEVATRTYAQRDRQWHDSDTHMMQYVHRVAPTVEQ